MLEASEGCSRASIRDEFVRQYALNCGTTPSPETMTVRPGTYLQSQSNIPQLNRTSLSPTDAQVIWIECLRIHEPHARQGIFEQPLLEEGW